MWWGGILLAISCVSVLVSRVQTTSVPGGFLFHFISFHLFLLRASNITIAADLSALVTAESTEVSICHCAARVPSVCLFVINLFKVPHKSRGLMAALTKGRREERKGKHEERKGEEQNGTGLLCAGKIRLPQWRS